MHQEIRTIWITTAHVRSWDHHAGLKSLRSLRLINIEHNMTGDSRGRLLKHLTCVRNYGRDPRSVVDNQDRRHLVNLSVHPDGGFLNERTTPKLRPIVAKDNENPDQLKIHVHFRCASCTCFNHCRPLHYRYPHVRHVITKTMVRECGAPSVFGEANANPSVDARI